MKFILRLCYNKYKIGNYCIQAHRKDLTMKTLFVTDLDGTLLTKNENVSAYSLDKLNRLVDAGMLFTYATARSVWSAEAAVRGLKITAPAILYNGGMVYDFGTKTCLRAITFLEDWKEYVLSVLQGHGIHPLVFSAEIGGERVKWVQGNETPGLQRYLSRRTEDRRMHPVNSNGDLLAGNLFYFKCIGPRELLERAWDILKFDSRFLCIFHQETYQNDFWMEISPREASKANAVSFLKQVLGCDKTVCFGDTSNDSDMFDVCDEKYAVMNADAWLKEKATGVIGYCEEDGVAKWLEEHSGFGL